MSVIDAAIDDIVSPADYPARAAPPSAVEDASLALSVSTWGVLKPVLLRQCGNGLVLIDGARRLAAARAAGRNEVPAKIFAADDPISDATVRATEMLRAPIHPVDRWRSIKQLMDSGLTLDRAADTLGVDHRAARRLLRLGSIIPPILHEIAVQNRGPNESQLRTIAQAPEKVQKAAWRVHRNATQRGMWFDLAGACGVTRALRRNARFDDEAAARRGIVWEEDLFAPADQDSRHTTDLTAFRLAQQEWMEAEVLGLIGLGYQAEVLPPGPHGMAAMPKGMEVHLGDEKNAGKAVIRGYWMDGQALVRLHLYKRPKPAADNAAKPDGKPAPGGAPAPTEAKPPRGISKKGLVLIAEAKEAAVRGRLAELEVEASASNAITLLNALLVALAGSNVQIGTTDRKSVV